MANGPSVQVDRVVSRRRRIADVLLRLVRRQVVAYVVIAFAVSFGFHIEEKRTDRHLHTMIVRSCQQRNDVIQEANSRLMVLAEANPLVVPIEYVDCTRLDK